MRRRELARLRVWIAVAAAAGCSGAGAGPGADDLADAGVSDASAPADASADAAAPSGAFVEPPLAPPQRTGDTRCQLPGTRADALPRLQAQPILDPLRF